MAVLAHYTLRRKNIPLVHFRLEAEQEVTAGMAQTIYQVHVTQVEEESRHLLPGTLREQLTDASLLTWIDRRKAPKNRQFVDQIMHAIADDENPLRYVDISHALSLNDAFWITNDDVPSLWKDFNLYSHPFDEVLAYVAFTGYSKRVSGVISSPELTSSGALKKCWSNRPDGIYLIKGDDFINEFIELVRAGRGSEFRAKYRDADLLLVDDVQFVAGKEQVQNEFFHTFNTLYEAGRQIVLTSDRPPSDMHLLDDRLRTRFEWGLLVDVQPPDFETRLAIVKNKAAQWGTVIDDDIARYIAENVTSNVRQLEGTMNKILAYRDLIGREMDADAAHRAVEDFMKKNANLAPTAAMIITETSRYFGIDEEVIKGPSRSREAVNARQAAMYLVRRMTNLSTPDIGREFGKRDHTTVLHSLEQIEKKMKSDPVFNQTIKEITININSKR